MSVRLSVLTALLLLVVSTATDSQSAEGDFTAAQIEFFELHIRPLLVQHCYECHSTDAVELKAGLYVDHLDGVLEGGESGPSVVPGDPDGSLLIQAVKYQTFEMPPDRKLSDQQIDTLVEWVEMGAPWPQVTTSPGIPMREQVIDWEQARAAHWAWQAVQRPEPPLDERDTSPSPIDRFVDQRRRAAGIQKAPVAEPHVLARRVFSDLIGLPPTPEQLADFARAAAVDRSSALAALVDELLASPLYGQRWARHWLDVARYSDGYGGFLDSQGLGDAWRYRDWVVKAFNDDMPFDRFLELQIAGDLFGGQNEAIATGFFALGPTYKSDGGDPDSIAQAKGETLDDRVDTLTRGMLGITVSCARCHDHKFDPIPQQDYYSLAGVFNNTEVHSLPLAPDEVVQRFNEHKKKTAELDRNIKSLEKSLKQQQRTATEDENKQLGQWKADLANLKEHAPPAPPTAHVLRDNGSADMKVALRGNLRKEGDLAPRRFLRIVTVADTARFHDGSGRRELAEAITDPANPLTARVFVNRVWMHHFGQALVRTPSNFGILGEKPTHPQLLDWLAAEFVANGWSMKALHWLVMTSRTYQLSSRFVTASYESDADNRLLWRMNPRRMDVEVWRDSLLAVSGELDPLGGGPPVDDVTTNRRRTLYAKVSRNGDQFASDNFLRRFDFPLMRATVAKRPQSVVPQQYLFLLNSSFMVDRAKRLTERLDTAASTDEARIRYAYQLLYSRMPSPSELQVGLDYIDSVSARGDLTSWVQYAQVLLSSNEFMFVR
jgi:hypothetical protein